MGLFDFIFGKTRKIDHDFFGQMTFVGSEDQADSYFECRRPFKPSNEMIEIGIDGDISGPTKTQIDFFKNIEDNYSSVINSITPLVEDEFKNWKENFKIADFKKEFEPVYLEIPKCDSNKIIWKIVFDSEHDENHTFTLTMENLEAKEILIDG